VLVCTLTLMSYPMQELWQLWTSKGSSYSQTVAGTVAVTMLDLLCCGRCLTWCTRPKTGMIRQMNWRAVMKGGSVMLASVLGLMVAVLMQESWCPLQSRSRTLAIGIMTIILCWKTVVVPPKPPKLPPPTVASAPNVCPLVAPHPNGFCSEKAPF
jgi:hypothetical protein